ncbi:hypothetical protein F4823DRAFT_604320 [Ustulina deusta]|nr:hypothetical protein F4823DRAFT_604320 [Ustulina deusta]
MALGPLGIMYCMACGIFLVCTRTGRLEPENIELRSASSPDFSGRMAYSYDFLSVTTFKTHLERTWQTKQSLHSLDSSIPRLGRRRICDAGIATHRAWTEC